LDVARIPNNGAEEDPLLGARYIGFYNPDSVAGQLYAMPATS
jgi:hypothetical protein